MQKIVIVAERQRKILKYEPMLPAPSIMKNVH